MCDSIGVGQAIQPVRSAQIDEGESGKAPEVGGRLHLLDGRGRSPQGEKGGGSPSSEPAPIEPAKDSGTHLFETTDGYKGINRGMEPKAGGSVSPEQNNGSSVGRSKRVVHDQLVEVAPRPAFRAVSKENVTD